MEESRGDASTAGAGEREEKRTEENKEGAKGQIIQSHGCRIFGVHGFAFSFVLVAELELNFEISFSPITRINP